MNTHACNVEDINILHIKNVCCCLVLHLLRIGPASFALDHSPCARMIWILTTCMILRRCDVHIIVINNKSVRVLCEQTGWLFKISLPVLTSMN